MAVYAGDADALALPRLYLSRPAQIAQHPKTASSSAFDA
jgi:hypothetical protein